MQAHMTADAQTHIHILEHSSIILLNVTNMFRDHRDYGVMMKLLQHSPTPSHYIQVVALQIVDT